MPGARCLRFALIVALGAFVAPAARADVWVVDDVPGPGVDATDVATAVALAAPGDTILIQPGIYAGVTIGKGVTIVGESPVRVDGISVIGLPAGQTVRLQNLKLRFKPSPSTAAALELLDAAGLVVVEGCSVEANLEVGPRPGCSVTGCASVVISSCGVQGGGGINFMEPTDFETTPGGEGLHVSGSGLVLVDASTVYGGPGGGDSQSKAWHGARGGDGLVVDDGLVHVTATQIGGGNGGFDTYVLDPASGDGGDGLVIDGPATVRLRDSSMAGGKSGVVAPGGTPGVFGEPRTICCGGTAIALPGKPPLLSSAFPVLQEGQTASVELSGVPFVPGVLLVSLDATALDVPKFGGVLVAGAPLAVIPYVLGSGGFTTVNATVPELGPGMETFDLVLQCIAGNDPLLSNMDLLALFDASF